MELIYQYKKGEGWVLGPPNDYWEIEGQGNRYTFEHRRPEIGEHFYYLHTHSEHVFNGKIQFAALFKSLSSWAHPPTWNSALLTEEHKNSGAWHFDDPLWTHVTLTITKL